MTLVPHARSVSLAAMSCDHVGTVGINGHLFTALFCFLRPIVCVHVAPTCLKTWAKVIQVKSSVLGMASSLKKLRWDK